MNKIDAYNVLIEVLVGIYIYASLNIFSYERNIAVSLYIILYLYLYLNYEDINCTLSV